MTLQATGLLVCCWTLYVCTYWYYPLADEAMSKLLALKAASSCVTLA